MFFIDGVKMDGDNIGDSVEQLEDGLIRDIAMAIPQIDTVGDDERTVMMIAVAALVTDRTQIKADSAANMDTNRFNINISLIGKMIAKEINEKIPFNVSQFSRLFSMTMSKKYGFLLGNSVIGDILNVSTLPEEVTRLVQDKRPLLIATFNKLRNK